MRARPYRPIPPGSSGVSGAPAVISVGGAEAADLDELAPVYAAVFSRPPFDEPDAQGLIRRLPAHAQREGFAIAVARVNGRAVGFVYGYTGRFGQVWTDLVAAALGPDRAPQLLDGHFELVELAVLPGHRGSGIGAALLDAVLAGRPEPRVLLQTADGDTPAMRLYRRRGFQQVAVLNDWPVLAKDLP